MEYNFDFTCFAHTFDEITHCNNAALAFKKAAENAERLGAKLVYVQDRKGVTVVGKNGFSIHVIAEISPFEEMDFTHPFEVALAKHGDYHFEDGCDPWRFLTKAQLVYILYGLSRVKDVPFDKAQEDFSELINRAVNA